MVQQLKKRTYLKREKSAQAALTDAERRYQDVRPRIFPWYCCVRSIFCCYCNSGRVEGWLRPSLGILEGAAMLCIQTRTSLIADHDLIASVLGPVLKRPLYILPACLLLGFSCVFAGSFFNAVASPSARQMACLLPPLHTFYHLCQHGLRFQASMHECQVSMGILMDNAHCCHSERHMWSDQ